jgi:hypothetical protein
MPKIKPMPPYFLIRIKRADQKAKRESIGAIKLSPKETFMIYNVQYGEILSIGKRAAAYFPEAKVGHTLICHHFVQDTDDTEARVNHLVHQDSIYNYYVVTAYEIPGKGNETFGVWDGHKIIPNKEYVFLEPEKPAVKWGSNDEHINARTKKTKGGLLVFKDWKEDKETLIERMGKLKAEISSLCKTGVSNPIVRQMITAKEKELDELVIKVNLVQFEPYTVVAAPKILSEMFGMRILPGKEIYILSNAAQMGIEVMGKNYRIAKVDVKYIGYTMVS